MHGARASGARQHEQRRRSAPQRSACIPASRRARVEEVAEGDERCDGGKRERGEQRIEREAVGSCRVGERRQRHQQHREVPGVPRRIASPPGRTILLCSKASSPKKGMATLTWLGHAAFRLDSDAGKRIYVDPFLTGNPRTPEDEKSPRGVDVIAITHGHGDHVGDTVELSQRVPGGAGRLPGRAEGLARRAGRSRRRPAPGLNKGGTQEIDGIHFTLVNAFHSSSSNEGEYLGESCGLVIRLEDGRAVYFAGDTCVFGDMALIRASTRPTTPCCRSATTSRWARARPRVALELLGNPPCIPCH